MKTKSPTLLDCNKNEFRQAMIETVETALDWFEMTASPKAQLCRSFKINNKWFTISIKRGRNP